MRVEARYGVGEDWYDATIVEVQHKNLEEMSRTMIQSYALADAVERSRNLKNQIINVSKQLNQYVVHIEN